LDWPIIVDALNVLLGYSASRDVGSKQKFVDVKIVWTTALNFMRNVNNIKFCYDN
jgi:hypothetical protein